jgi:small conductance mechanosensitive channel
LAVAITGLLLLFAEESPIDRPRVDAADDGAQVALSAEPNHTAAPNGGDAQSPAKSTRAAGESSNDADAVTTGERAVAELLEEADPQRSLEEATDTMRGLINGLVSVMPKVIVALLLLLIAWLLSIAVRVLLHRLLSGWEKSEAVSAMVRIALFLLAIGAGLSVISGDAMALVGSVGLIGLALSWALQTPIESFTGWVLNALRGYYRPGDRIEVGDVFGDVYRIDVLNTTVWEAGGPGKAVAGAQPTGALVTFPNWEILRSSIINYSRDFPYVWDEITVTVANESDLDYTVDVIRAVAEQVVGPRMQQPATEYGVLLERQHLAQGVEDKPQVYVALADTTTAMTVRYLVPVKERRRWSTDLLLAVSRELAKPVHRGRILAGYPRTKIDLLSAENCPNAENCPTNEGINEFWKPDWLIPSFVGPVSHLLLATECSSLLLGSECAVTCPSAEQAAMIPGSQGLLNIRS